MSKPRARMLGVLLRQRREALGLTFQKVADFLGRSRTSYSGLEKGVGRIHLEEGLLLCEFLQISWEEFKPIAEDYAKQIGEEK